MNKTISAVFEASRKYLNPGFSPATVIVLLLMTPKLCSAQTPFYSKTIIKYDLATHTTDKPIPFDQSFTLIIDKLSAKDLRSVDAYEADFKDGERIHVANTFIDCNGKKLTIPVKDIDVERNRDSDTLQLFFKPLKPNKNFDIFVVYKLPGTARDLLYAVNSKIASGDSTSAKTFGELFSSTIDPRFNISSFSITDYSEYLAFYNTNLASFYAQIADPANYKKGGFLTELEVQALDLGSSGVLPDFKNGSNLMEVVKGDLWTALQYGLIDIKKMFLIGNEPITLAYGHTRLKNLESNLAFLDSALARTDRMLSMGMTSVEVGAAKVRTSDLYDDLQSTRSNAQKNYTFLKKELQGVDAETDGDARMGWGVYLAGNTVASDLKTSGGNVLFIDAGISNIIVPGLNDKAVYIPKLYWGVSIYFRPIDKNTRSNRFHKTFSPEENDGCKTKVIRNEDGTIKEVKYIYGPDYGIVSKWSWKQRVSINIGITLGGMQNKDFDNFYNNSSLLVGPAYRFARAFKIGGGIALVKRTSKNPLKSEKQITAGGYLALSVDLDFIQSIKDITSILFK